MNRRSFLAAAALLLTASLPAYADSSISVVKIVNFTCPISRASELQDAAIALAASNTGGSLIVAPLPNEEGSYGRELIYYAARKQGTFAETQIRESLYKGTQDLGFPMKDIPQTIEWLKDDLANASIDWAQLAADAQTQPVRASLGRAASLALRAGSQALPSYILIKDNKPVATLDITTTGKGTSLLALREEIVNRINKLAETGQ